MLRISPARQQARAHNAVQIALDQHQMRADCIAMSVPCTHCNADIGGCQGRGIVDSVSCHRDDPALCLQRLDQCILVSRLHFGTEIGNAELRRHCGGCRNAITGSHNDPHAGSV